MKKFSTFLIGFCLCMPLYAKQFTIEQWTTKNGAKVVFVQAHQVPMLTIKMAFHAGSAYDGKLYGIGALTADLLNQGNKGLSATQIAQDLADTGAQFSVNTTRDMTILDLRTLSNPKALKKSVASFELIVKHPDFNSQAVKREKQQQLAAILQSQESPRDVASTTFFELLYGKHPYAHPIIGTTDSVKSITQKDIKQFYSRFFVAKNTTISIVGDINLDNAKQLSEQITKGLKTGVKASAIKKATPLSKAIVKNISYPSSQTVLQIGQLGISHDNSHYFPLIVGNYTLGGGSLVSRLAIEVREKRGLSYGISSYFSPMPGRGPFIVNLATKNQQARQALLVTEKTIKQFIQQGPNEDEILAAKKYITGSFPLNIASNNNIANMILKIAFYGLPIDYLDTYIDKIDAVTKEQINMAFNDTLKPKHMLFVSVGKTSPFNS
jgi:zinc protease